MSEDENDERDIWADSSQTASYSGSVQLLYSKSGHFGNVKQVFTLCAPGVLKVYTLAHYHRLKPHEKISDHISYRIRLQRL